jgi:DNA-binding MarR family transcriptional regulator
VTDEPDVEKLAAALRVNIGLLFRGIRQAQLEAELTFPETSALARLDLGGPTTATELASREQISPQSMGATLGALEARGLIDRRPDPEDGRKALVTLTTAGFKMLRNRRSARDQQMVRALSREFTRAELEQLVVAAALIERLAQTL